MYSSRYKLLFILLLVIYSHINILFTEGYRLFGFQIPQYTLFLSLLAFVFIIWESNRLLSKWIIDSHRKEYLNLGYLFVASVLVLFTCIIAPAVSIIYFLGVAGESVHDDFRLITGFAFRINLFLNCVHAIYFFMRKLEQSRLEAAHLKQEQAEVQLTALQNQVNPHFLFNNLNVLSTLVRKDPDKAEEFIHELSLVYRYILQSQNQSLTPLKNELEFLEAYLFLIQIRFPKGIDIQQEHVPMGMEHYLLPPMTLQILIENVIKHNEIGTTNLLKLKITYQESLAQMTIENNRLPKQVISEKSGHGIANIKERFELLGKKVITVEALKDTFRVHIPLIKP